jgi:hypothetical protein
MFARMAKSSNLLPWLGFVPFILAFGVYESLIGSSRAYVLHPSFRTGTNWSCKTVLHLPPTATYQLQRVVRDMPAPTADRLFYNVFLPIGLVLMAVIAVYVWKMVVGECPELLKASRGHKRALIMRMLAFRRCGCSLGSLIARMILGLLRSAVGCRQK